MRYILILSIVFFGVESLAQELIYFEDFSSRRTKFRWVPFPYYFLDNLEIGEEESPGKDNLVGILSNKKVGGFAAPSYVLRDPLIDFYVETHILCQVSNSPKGPLNGIPFLVDPEEGNFYRIVCDFNSENPSLNLAYVGTETRHFPAYLRFWGNKDTPGGVPKVRLKLKTFQYGS